MTGRGWLSLVAPQVKDIPTTSSLEHEIVVPQLHGLGSLSGQPITGPHPNPPFATLFLNVCNISFCLAIVTQFIANTKVNKKIKIIEKFVFILLL